jgi:hypothetical protein
MSKTAVDESKLDIEAMLAVMNREFDYTRGHVYLMRTGEAHRTGFGGWLIVNQCSYGKVDVDSVLNHTADVQEAILTEDGAGANTREWHSTLLDGPSEHSVYVERWTPKGRQFHGYVDSVSRKVVQTG